MKSLAVLGNELYSGKTSIPFIAKRRIWYGIAAVVIIASFALLGAIGLNPGIDFKGGSEVTITGIQNPQVGPANDVIAKGGYSAGSSVTTMGSASVRVQTESLEKAKLDQLAGELATAYGVTNAEVSATTIGPTWSGDVTGKALRGLIIFFLLVGALIWAYFRTWKMAAAALLALCHDIVITMGVYVISGFEVTPATVIGVLTILGYSLYDTVVVFDKIRENTAGFQAQSRSTYAELANLAVNQTFIRSINTSVVGVLPVASLLFVGAFILGAGTLRDIALTMFIGMLAGTLSSVFLATPLLVDLRSREKVITEQAEKVAKARAKRVAELDGDEEAVASLAAAPAAAPLTPGHHLGVSAQPKRKKKRS
ncbi:preprotein translocase subunit SecF [Actinomyces bovis]|uniref:Protein-export membrane protein SecF n=1 Tax=Actinomyces bovis TaxID=1658 RepID=A0ABY1VPU9_9ACTO|nr:protein translocase subunit SecF [Actinomyces bovis]SPT54085.1 preprotein translocase subunit SecF [Actinomyces bovis]VEG53706.1 preprotein translocase subunit SecF [Actinomyces israelii]